MRSVKTCIILILAERLDSILYCDERTSITLTDITWREQLPRLRKQLVKPKPYVRDGQLSICVLVRAIKSMPVCYNALFNSYPKYPILVINET